jgi:radical SAM-linked protein
MRVRIRFAKLGKIRWTSHRDVARMWERAFRRAELPLAYSEGFSPRPKVSFGLALPTGYESEAEYLDVELRPPGVDDLSALTACLSDALPVGVDATGVVIIPPGTPSLQEDVMSCSWRVAVSGLTEVEARVEGLLGASSAVVARHRKGVSVEEDIRASILHLQPIGPGGPDLPEAHWLEAELAAQPRSIRPAEVLLALGPGLEERMVRRTHQWILRDGARREPLDRGFAGEATAAPHALGRAS